MQRRQRDYRKWKENNKPYRIAFVLAVVVFMICAPEVNVINPGFDVTPHELITGIITEKGILKPNFEESIKKVFEQK